MLPQDNALRGQQKWYNRLEFPLVPIIHQRKPDKYNTRFFSFRWLFFQGWTLDSFGFEIALVASTHWGLGVIGILPYLRWAVTIPCPRALGEWVYRNLDRKVGGERSTIEAWWARLGDSVDSNKSHNQV